MVCDGQSARANHFLKPIGLFSKPGSFDMSNAVRQKVLSHHFGPSAIKGKGYFSIKPDRLDDIVHRVLNVGKPYYCNLNQCVVLRDHVDEVIGVDRSGRPSFAVLLVVSLTTHNIASVSRFHLSRCMSPISQCAIGRLELVE